MVLDRKPARVGTAAVQCPECGGEIPIDVMCRLERNENTGTQSLICEPDMTDVWAHAWEHTQVNP